ncbi:MAG: hypothetical protein P4L50_16970 [Anaerolineaceae bacterium]|nr:hypothetical protein [Anaerolineaceae bacterium]
MSGYKRTTVSISPAEYKRLHDAEMKLRFMEKDLPELMNEFEEDKTANLQQDFSQLEKRQNDFFTMLNGFNDQIRDIEAQTSQSITNQGVEYWNSLQTVLENNQQNNTQELFDQTRLYNDQVAKEINNHQQEISELNLTIIDLGQQQYEKNQFAQDWISTGQNICQFIDEHFDQRFINPGQLDSLIARLNQAQKNLDYGLDEAALVSAQDVYARSSELRIELEKRQSEWEILYSTARQQTRQLYILATHSSPCPALDIQGNQLPVQIDVDFWTSGSLNKLVGTLKANLADFDQNKFDWNSALLKDYLQETLPGIRSDLDNLVYQARINVLSSQLRINIADVVIQALASQGFEIQESLYSNDDMRKSYCARLGNLEGSQVVVKISPIQSEPGQNQLHLHSLDAGKRTQHELQQRAVEISHALRQYGLKVGNSKTSAIVQTSVPPIIRNAAQANKSEPIHAQV